MGLGISRFVVSRSGALPARRTMMTPRLRGPVASALPAAAPLSRSSLFSTKAGKATPRPLQTVPLDLKHHPDFHYSVPIATSQEHAAYSAVDTDDVLYLRVNMPGVPRDGAEVGFDPTTDRLVVKGLRVADPDIAETMVAYGCDGFGLSTQFFCTDRIEYAMNNGMLVLSIPKKVTGEVVCYDGATFSINNSA
ncbi:hypothetical protein RHMOL_Rhmol07G0011000 [Rhododendron molle]|uniref:Uncharacterized protein n=1 Tax=Rhododendron molle TaxID=49168 RepID=A0ACC0MVI0_RHOML|nr:hypothetical protein RHMOL_Rhmol07G0011000 [Rhododendron molle]